MVSSACDKLEGTQGWAVSNPAPPESSSPQRQATAAAAPAAVGTPCTPHGPVARSRSAEKQASGTPTAAAKASTIPWKVLQKLVEAMLVAEANGSIPRPSESAGERSRCELGVPEEGNVQPDFVVETPPRADLFKALLAADQSQFRNRDAKEVAKALTHMSTAQHKKLSAAGAKASGEKEAAQTLKPLWHALSTGLPLRNRKLQVIYYRAGQQPCRWNGCVIVGVGYFRVGHPRDEEPFQTHFAAFQEFVREAYTADARQAFEGLESEEQMNQFEEELKALQAAFEPWETGVNFPTTLHPAQQAHRAAKARVPEDAQPASNTRKRDDKVLEAANLAAQNVHAEMVVDTAVAVGDALLKGDHTVYDFFSAVKRFKDRLKLRTPPMESGPVSNTAVSAQEHASQDAMQTD
jgi:hypothetical protein